MVFIGYNSSRPLDGILSYIYYNKSSSFYKITASKGKESYNNDFLLRRNKDECGLWYGVNESQNWTIKLTKKLLLINYEFENAGCSKLNRTYPVDFNLLGSNDGETWTVLDSRTNQLFCNTKTCKDNIIFEYSIQYPRPFYYFRIQNIKNSNNYEYMILRSFEMYGQLITNACSCKLKQSKRISTFLNIND